MDVERIVAPNPGPMTLEGTNTYVVGRSPATVIDPGPDDRGHIEAVVAAAAARGGLGAVLLTHAHADHSDGVEALGLEPREPADGASVAGLLAIATPGHSHDHFCFLMDPGHPAARRGAVAAVCFSGDLILGRGSSIVGPSDFGGSLADYMASLERLRAHELELILPGHGPEITDPDAKIDEYVEHRLMRERGLLTAIERGERSRSALLDEVWDDVPAAMRPAAGIAMRAHLEKLEAEGRLPADLVD